MKHWAYTILLTIISCCNQQQSVSSSEIIDYDAPTILKDTKTDRNQEMCWKGTLNGRIPIFIHYQLDGNLIIGEITYLNTKAKKPITLLGTIEDDNNYRLLEFDKKGNITGIITGEPTDKNFHGSWYSPKSSKELSMKLSLADTIIYPPNIKTIENEIFGNYYYQYGENGYNGYFEINQVGNGKVDFYILSLTNVERGSNIAEVEKDTIAMKGSSLIYTIPDSDKCEFKIEFYKDFAYISYTNGYCSGQFGLNATIEGIYLKIK